MHFTWPAWDKTQSRLALFVNLFCVASVLRKFETSARLEFVVLCPVDCVVHEARPAKANKKKNWKPGTLTEAVEASSQDKGAENNHEVEFDMAPVIACENTCGQTLKLFTPELEGASGTEFGAE